MRDYLLLAAAMLTAQRLAMTAEALWRRFGPPKMRRVLNSVRVLSRDIEDYNNAMERRGEKRVITKIEIGDPR